MGQIILPRRRALLSGTENIAAEVWVNWDGVTESDLALDTPGNLIYVCVAAGGAGANEFGQGGNVTGANLELTDATAGIGAVAGGFRAVAATEYLSCTAPLLASTLENKSAWSIIHKVKDVAYSVGENDYIFNFNGNVGGVDSVNMYRYSAVPSRQKLYCVYAINGANIVGATPADDLPDSGTYWLYAFHTGTNCYMGFSAVRPVTVAQVTVANQYLSAADTNVMNSTFNVIREMIGDAAHNSVLEWGISILADSCLIPGLV